MSVSATFSAAHDGFCDRFAHVLMMGGAQAMGTDKDRRGEIEALLEACRQGDAQACEALFKRVYDDLRRMAGNLMVHERDNHTLQPTALVHEAYLKVFVGQPLRSADRAYFFAAQARAMRQLLVEHARRRNAMKRPDHRDRVPLDDILEHFEITHRVAMHDLDKALKKLQAMSERQHQVVVLRFFGGLGWKEIAELVDTSVSTVEKDWQAGRAWLRMQLRSEP
jgi:RNA polymerase sigma factor (TIGR02999 family)